MDTDSLTALIIFLGFPVFFVLFWTAVCYLLGWVGGWQKLAADYHHTASFLGQTYNFRNGRMKWVNYKNVLTLGADTKGLYIAVLFLFRIGHPPLFIPWQDINTTEEKGVFGIDITNFQFLKHPSISLKVWGSVGKQVLQAGNKY